MAYRDDLEAAQARVAELERQLAESQEELAVARGHRSQALVLADRGALAARGEAGDESAATRWLGAPLRLAFSRKLDGIVPDSAHTEIIELIRERLGDVGAVSRLEGSLAWTSSAHHKSTGPFVSVTVSSRNGVTTIRVDEKLGNLAGAIYGGIGGGIGGGAIVLPILVAIAAAPVGVLAIPAWIGGTWFGCRGLYKRMARGRAERLQALTDALAEIASRHARIE